MTFKSSFGHEFYVTNLIRRMDEVIVQRVFMVFRNDLGIGNAS